MRLEPPPGETHANYYDARWAGGYIEEWPPERRERIVALLREMGAHDRMAILEYGCGLGIFSNEVKRTWPACDSHGCDISRTALDRGAAKFPATQRHLLTPAGLLPPMGQFDLAFSHHVLEHVSDIDWALGVIAAHVKPGGRVLHIVPCGNPGSFEWRVCDRTRGGFTGGPEGKFFFEDISHLRRFTSQSLAEHSARHGLVLERAYFGNHGIGAVDDLSRYWWSDVAGFFQVRRGKTLGDKLALAFWKAVIGGLSILRYMPRRIVSSLGEPRPPAKRALFILGAPLALLALPASWAAMALLRWAAIHEWETRRTEPNGSEMYLIFRRV